MTLPHTGLAARDPTNSPGKNFDFPLFHEMRLNGSSILENTPGAGPHASEMTSGRGWECAATQGSSARRGGAATRSVTAAAGLSPRRQLTGAEPVPRQHGGRDPLAAAEQPARPPQQGRGAPGRGERRAPHPQGGRGHHGQRGQVSEGRRPGPGPPRRLTGR